MDTPVLVLGFAMLAFLAAGVVAVQRVAARELPPPPRPEELRERLAGPRANPPKALVLFMLAGPMLALMVPGVLLLAVSDSPRGRSIGVLLLGYLAVIVLISRPWRIKKAGAKLLARSEAYWSTHGEDAPSGANPV